MQEEKHWQKKGNSPIYYSLKCQIQIAYFVQAAVQNPHIHFTVIWNRQEAYCHLWWAGAGHSVFCLINDLILLSQLTINNASSCYSQELKIFQLVKRVGLAVYSNRTPKKKREMQIWVSRQLSRGQFVGCHHCKQVLFFYLEFSSTLCSSILYFFPGLGGLTERDKKKLQRAWTYFSFNCGCR